MLKKKNKFSSTTSTPVTNRGDRKNNVRSPLLMLVEYGPAYEYICAQSAWLYISS